MAARRAFERLIEVAPGFAGGYAGAAYTHAFYAFWGHSQSREEDIQKAIELAAKANELDASFGLSFSALAFAYLSLQDFDKALASSSEAVRVQPGSPYVNAYHGYILSANGQAKRGIEFAKRALRLDPLFERTPYLNILGVSCFHAGQFQHALNALLKNVERGGPYNPGVQAYIVATYASLGRHDEARTAFEYLNMNNGGFAWEDWIRRSFKHERDIELVLRPIRDLGID